MIWAPFIAPTAHSYYSTAGDAPAVLAFRIGCQASTQQQVASPC